MAGAVTHWHECNLFKRRVRRSRHLASHLPGGERPRQPFALLYQQKKKGGGWSVPVALAKVPDDWNGYTHYHNALTIAKDNTLHIAYNIYYIMDGHSMPGISPLGIGVKYGRWQEVRH